MKRKIALLLVIAAATVGLFLFLQGRHSSRIPPTDFIPAASGKVAILASAERLGSELNQLASRKVVNEALELAGIPPAKELLDKLATMLGADIRDAKSLAAAGIDGTAPVCVFTLDADSKSDIAAIPVASPEAIHRWLDGRIQALLGGIPRKDEADTRFLRYASGESGPDAASAVLHGGYLYIAQGPDSAKLLERALATPKNASLTSFRPFHKGAQSLGHPTLRVFARTSGVQISAGLDLTGTVTDGTSLKVHLAADTKAESVVQRGMAAVFSELTGLSAFQPTPADITSRLDPDAALLLQSGISPQETVKVFSVIAPTTASRLKGLLFPTGMTLEKLAAEFLPGAAMSVSLAPSANLMALTSLDRLRSTSAFDIIHLEFLAKVRNEEKIRRVIDAAAGAAPALGIQVQRFAADGTFIDSASSPLGGLRGIVAALGLMGQNASSSAQDANVPRASRWVCGFRQGEGFTVELRDGTLLVAGGGKQVYDALSSRNASPEAPRGIDASGAVLHLDFRQLVSSIRAIPESSFGMGGAVIKATLDKWLRTFDGIQSLRVSASGSGGGALDLTASLELQNTETAGSGKAVP